MAVIAASIGLGATEAAARQAAVAARLGTLARQVEALGDRVRAPEKSRTVLAGQLAGEDGTSRDVQVIHQFSGEVRIADGMGNTRASFDGARLSGAWTPVEEKLIETLAMDTAQGMLESVGDGGALALLGLGFGPDPAVNPGYAGPRVDIFEVTAPNRVRTGQPVTTRRYYFDSATGLLLRTRYRTVSAGREIVVETHILEWGTRDGSTYPVRIDRIEDGRTVLSFKVGAVGSGPAEPRSNFQ